jgi:eukaryotic-like serine/threonine-protein kinase
MLEGDDPRIGRVIHLRYKILDHIGSGSMGVIYRAERVGLGRMVAIKFLHTGTSGQTEFVRRLDREARAMSRLSHPNCVPVIDAGVDDEPYLVMEYVHGRSLADLIDGGPVPSARAVAITSQILAGLAHAHELGIIHRDIKAANVLITEATGAGDLVKLVDFGLAKILDRKPRATWSTDSGTAVGTPSYLAPEVARGQEADARSDLYSVGVLLFEMVTGRKPFRGDAPVDIIRQHLQDAPPSLSDAAASRSFSPLLEGVVAKALAKAPDDRYQTALEFSRALEALGPRPRSAPQLSRVMGAAGRTSGRTWIIALAALAIALGVGLFLAMR